METLLQDVRYGLRMLAKAPGFTAVAVLTLALGIGANTAIFSLTDQVLLRLLPVPQPQKLVVLLPSGPEAGRISGAEYERSAPFFSYSMYENLRDRNNVFSGLLAYYGSLDMNVYWQGHVERASGELVSGNFFQVLGARPALGRIFSPEDEIARGGNPVAVLSYDYWARDFGGDPSILNQSLEVNGTLLTVVGVAQERFTGVQVGAQPDIYIPVTINIMNNKGRNGLSYVGNSFLTVIGRLKFGMTRERAQAGLQPLYHAILESELPQFIAGGMLTTPQDQKEFLAGGIKLTPGAHGRPVLEQGGQTLLIFLIAMVGVVLVTACVNLGGLQLARGEARHHEVAVRVALGASRGRLIRQLLTESLLVAIAGGAAGLLIGWWTLSFTLSAIPRSPGGVGLTANLDPRLLEFAAAATVLSSIIFGLLPALRASRANLRTALQEQGVSSSGGTESVRLRKSLIVVQVAMTTMLLVSSVLLGNSLVHLENVNLGMNIGHVMQFSFDPALSGYSPAQTVALVDRLQRDILTLPGVASVSAAEFPLLTGWMPTAPMTFQSYISGTDEHAGSMFAYVGPHFFSTMDIPLVDGRTFRELDAASSLKVCVISERVAQKFFAGRNPIGMRLAIGQGRGIHPNIEIVGIVGNAKYYDARDPGHPIVYFPYAQDRSVGRATFYIRAPIDLKVMRATLRSTVARNAPRLPIYDVRTLSEQLNDSMFDERFATFFILSLGLLAALLATVGLYGVIAYVVARRRREVGIRLALGAMPRDIASMILRQAVQLAAIGLAIGLVAALFAARLIASLLYSVKASDPLAYGLSVLLLLFVTLIASYVPARRAMRVNPGVALRDE